MRDFDAEDARGRELMDAVNAFSCCPLWQPLRKVYLGARVLRLVLREFREGADDEENDRCR